MQDDIDIAPAAPDRHAYFLDLDGTLAEICSRPEQARIAPAALRALDMLARRSGALAVVSGRDLDGIDRLLAPLRLPAAGIHGAERRDAGGSVHRAALAADLPDDLFDQIKQKMAQIPHALVENKGVAFALHYRAAPERGADVRAIAEYFLQRYPQLALQAGKCVFELKPRGVDKGSAIRAFMAERPFTGRRPVFVGDDLTDEVGFAAVNALGGESIKVGPGPSVARHRLADVGAVVAWLCDLVTGDNSA